MFKFKEEPKIETIPVSELSSEEQEKVEKLEEIINSFYAGREELQFYVDNIKDYLPASKYPASKYQKDKPLGLPEIEKEIENESLLGKIYENIDKKIRKEFAGSNFSRESIAAKIRNTRRRAKKILLKILETYQEKKQKDNMEERVQAYRQAKTIKERREIYDDLPDEVKELIEYKKFRLREMGGKVKELRQIRRTLNLLDFDKEIAREDEDIEAIRDIMDEEKMQQDKYYDVLNSSPEAYIWEAKNRLRDMKNVLDSGGKIIETPYVRQMMKWIDSKFQSKPAVFIHGEQGSGKSELAKHMCRTIYSKEWAAEWEKKNPKPKNREEIKKWEAKRQKEAIEPYVISGHKNMDVSEIFGERQIQKMKSKLSPEEQAKKVGKAIEDLENDFGRELSREEKETIQDGYRDLFNNPVEVVPMLGKFYKAMQEGRPIIIDEMNAIPHTVLIALNDLLTLKPGDYVQPALAGIEPFPIKKGFRVIATGNWKPEDGRGYIGRQTLDSAFLSRFGRVHYDYLPQRLGSTTENAGADSLRKEKEENELFDIMVGNMLDNRLGIRAPKGTLKKLRGLAVSARYIQDIFSEKSYTKDLKIQDPDEEGVEISDLKEYLHENVLSIRDLIPVIRKWKKEGFARPLDEYVFEYVDNSAGARPKEKFITYYILQKMSNNEIFYGEGWPDSMSKEGSKDLQELLAKDMAIKINKLSNFQETRKKISDSDMEYISSRQVIEEVFGPIPKRREIDKSIFGGAGKGEAKEGDIEALRALEEQKERLTESFRQWSESYADSEKDEEDEQTIDEIKNLLEE